MLVILYLMAKSSGFASPLPIIALYAYAGYRLMPAATNLWSHHSTALCWTGVDVLHQDLSCLQTVDTTSSPQLTQLSQAIELKGVTYRYPNAAHP